MSIPANNGPARAPIRSLCHLLAHPQVVRGESRNPLNQSEELMKVLDGTAAAATLG